MKAFDRAHIHRSIFAVLVLIASGCTPTIDPDTALALGEVEFTRATESGEPHLSLTPDGRAVLTWLEKSDETWAVQVAIREADGWTEPRPVYASPDLFVNWADFPSSVVMPDGTLAVHWLERIADAPYAYHVMLSLSSDEGRTWSTPFRAHDDESPTEHGFVSMVPWDDGAAVVWLDGRAMALEEGQDPSTRGAMSVRFRTLAADGTLGPEILLDDRTCECCQTALARGSEGLIAAYRDRSPSEIRDIAVVRGAGEQWSEPSHVATDGWEIHGCPVNGPQLSADGQAVAATWYTGVGGEPKTFAAFSQDGGATFGPRIRFDEGTPLGRVDVERLDDDSAVAVWLEASGEAPRILARRIASDGTLGPAHTVAETSGARSSGFPRMVRIGELILMAWAHPGEPAGVRVRSLQITD